MALTTSFTTENGDDQNTKCKWAEAILASERRIHTIAYDTIQVFETSNWNRDKRAMNQRT